MNFQFESFRDFMLMDGHGFYVWLCFLLTFALMVYLAVVPAVRTHQFIKQQKRIGRRLTTAQSASEPGSG